jgi:hypothetical protein
LAVRRPDHFLTPDNTRVLLNQIGDGQNSLQLSTPLWYPVNIASVDI